MRRYVQIVGLRIAVLALVMFLWGCREEIVHNLAESDSHHVLSFLQHRGFSAQRDSQPDGRWVVSVTSGDAGRAIAALSDQRLLRSEPKRESNGGVFSSREDNQLRYERGLSGAIEDTLRSIRGVREARVHLNLPAVDPLFGPGRGAAKGTGSVLLITDPDFVGQGEELASLVGGAVGLPATAISVVLRREEVRPSPHEHMDVGHQAVGWHDLRSVGMIVSVALMGFGLITLVRAWRVNA